MLPEPTEATDLNIYGDDRLPWSRVRAAMEADPHGATRWRFA